MQPDEVGGPRPFLPFQTHERVERHQLKERQHDVELYAAREVRELERGQKEKRPQDRSARGKEEGSKAHRERYARDARERGRQARGPLRHAPAGRTGERGSPEVEGGLLVVDLAV